MEFWNFEAAISHFADESEVEEEVYIPNPVRPDLLSQAALENIKNGLVKVHKLRDIILKMVMPTTIYSGIFIIYIVFVIAWNIKSCCIV